jgi:TonB family protein
MIFLLGLFLVGTCFGQNPMKAATAKAAEKGVVRLKIVLLATGKVGDITVVSGLTKELNDQAVEAARQIKFEPARVNGKPVDKLVTFDYGFHIYTDENDATVAKKAQIINFEKAKRPNGKEFKTLTGRVIADVILGQDGTVTINNIETTLPAPFKESVRKAVTEIKFEPAIDTSGKKISVDRKIEYEFTLQN